MKLLGLHHITAIASDPRTNLDFYTRVLGLRFVKKSVNQDDPGTYHLYYGDYPGSPGTVLTFFPWAGLRRGRPGHGQAYATAYSVPAGS
ncbi:MAG TPA: VOC family protein, partial [Opitutaceae bacterium]|nr:VOC family protein [Opitutaceae bacterium]